MSYMVLIRTIASLRRAARLGLLLAGGAASAIGFGAPARAEDSVITAITQQPTDDGFEIAFQLHGSPTAKLVYMRHPDRIALDFMDTVPAVEPPEIKSNTLVASIRHGLVSRDRYRLLLSLANPATASLRKAPDGGLLILRVEKSDRGSFDGAVERQAHLAELSSPAESNLSTPSPDASRPDARFIIVLDPGHGGVDDGAKSRGGTLEKDINLDFALALRDALADDAADIRVVLTRDTDVFVPLGERSAIARREGADLLISIHADSIRYGKLRGASVYTLSERASDALSQEIADTENASDRFADPRWQQEAPELFDILVELTRRETVSFSEHFASELVQQLGDEGVRLIKNPKRSAGFKVLKAPDVPSVLFEAGYLSNRQDEVLLNSAKWRKETAAAIAAAISAFLRKHPSAADAPGG